ncbi:MAG: helix-turn-helix domain-containing protein [Clostridiales bacterium]|nr:helix-turn-helix domain-containing protein [Clostridiales bacterium]
MKKINSQQNRILDYLTKHESITRLEAWNALGISELPKRISELRQIGYVIEDEWKEVTNRYGERTRVKAYSLPEEEVA